MRLFLSLSLLLVAATSVVELDGKQLSRSEISELYPVVNPNGFRVRPLSVQLEERTLSANMTLRQAAESIPGRPLRVGCATNANALADTSEPKYKATVAREYDLITAENACKWEPTEPSKNWFEYGGCTNISNFANATETVFRGHNLCWGNYNPKWLIDTNYTAVELQQFLVLHINTVVKKFYDSAVYWDVVNEAVSSKGPAVLKPMDPWYPALSNYIDIAFNTTRAAGPPSLKLFYNDYGAEGLGGKSDLVYGFVSDLIKRNIPIDGVGLQMHISVMNHPSFADVETNMKRITALGLEVQITELDVKCDKADEEAYATYLQLQEFNNDNNNNNNDNNDNNNNNNNNDNNNNNSNNNHGQGLFSAPGACPANQICNCSWTNKGANCHGKDDGSECYCKCCCPYFPAGQVCKWKPPPVPPKCGSPEMLDMQAQVYSGLLQTCLNVKGCTNFETWGFTDKHTWIGADSQPLPFDANYNPKPAYFAMVKTLLAAAAAANSDLLHPQPTMLSAYNATCWPGKLEGGDLHTANMTLTQATVWCSDQSNKCAGFSALAPYPSSCKASSSILGIHFKDEWGAQRLDPSKTWSTWLNSKPPPAEYHCEGAKCVLGPARVNYRDKTCLGLCAQDEPFGL